MAARKWYQNSKVAVPVLVALIGLAGTVVTVVIGKDGLGRKPETPATQPAQGPPPSAGITTIPAPGPVISFPVIVIDDTTGDHISGAQIVADEQGISTETDSQGRCSLSVRPGQGKLRVTVSRLGYRTQNVELTVFEGMDSARIRLQKS